MSGDPHECIPAIIGGGRVLLYTRIDGRHRPAAHGVSESYGLAICEEKDGPGVFLFTCEDDWIPVYDSWHSTVEEAKRQAEAEWIGVSQTWPEAPA